MKFIFLDIDGVMVNRASFRLPRIGIHARAHPDCVAALNHIIEQTGAQIVVSSVWRCAGVTKMREFCKAWGVKGKVISCTPDHAKQATNSTLYLAVRRGHEIQAWLDVRAAQRGDVDSFVILDDDADMEHLMPFLVQTQFEQGLTMKDAQKAVAMLNGVNVILSA